MKIYRKILMLLLPSWLIIAYINVRSSDYASPIHSGSFDQMLKFINKTIADYGTSCCYSNHYQFPPELVPEGIKYPFEEGTAILFSCPISSVVICNWKEWVVLYTIEKATKFRHDVALIPANFINSPEMWKFLTKNWEIDVSEKFKLDGISDINEVIAHFLTENIPVMTTANIVGITKYPSAQWGFARRIFPPDMDPQLIHSLAYTASATIFKKITTSTPIWSFPDYNALMYNGDSVFFCILNTVSYYDTINPSISDSLLDATDRFLFFARMYDYLMWCSLRQKKLGRDVSVYADRLKNELNGLVGYDVFIGLMEDSLEKIASSNSQPSRSKK